jgi:hypothetical protein
MTSFARLLLGWMGRNVVATLGLLALFLYAFLYVTYVAFYGRFGLEPNEVGLDYRETLSRGVGALPMILSLIFVVVLGFAVIYGAWWLLIRIAKAVRLVPPTASPIPPLRDFAAFAAVYGLLGGMLFGVVFITKVVPDDVAYVKDGGIIESADFFSPYSAEAAKLRWIGSAAPGVVGEAVGEGHELRYLGTSHGVYVLYDVDRQRSIEVSTSLAVLTILRRER